VFTKIVTGFYLIRVILRIFIAHAQHGRISTSGLKSDVTIVFLDLDFPLDAKISAIRVHGFSGPLELKWGFWGQNRGKDGAILTPTNSFFVSVK